MKFLVDDIESQWVYDKPFDFIHARFLAISIKNYKKLLQQAYELVLNCPFSGCFCLLTDMTRNTVPGGWVEIQDWDCTLRSEDGSTKNTSIEQYYDIVIGAFEKAGYETRPGPNLEQWFREVGFENIHVQKYRAPMGVWPKDGHLVSTIASEYIYMKKFTQ